jgi:hypothetical protein
MKTPIDRRAQIAAQERRLHALGPLPKPLARRVRAACATPTDPAFAAALALGVPETAAMLMRLRAASLVKRGAK